MQYNAKQEAPSVLFRTFLTGFLLGRTQQKLDFSPRASLNGLKKFVKMELLADHVDARGAPGARLGAPTNSP
jgi:hypothetical protein